MCYRLRSDTKFLFADENKNSRQHLQHNDSINHNMRNSGDTYQYHQMRSEPAFHNSTSNNINKDLNSYSPKTPIQSTVIYTSDEGPGLLIELMNFHLLFCLLQ